ncbi:MAG: polysaccharide deacetylase family protein [Clostridia bacterium]|nr:polysaccharide deacetylase family protein [Clostridia bacterium]
MFLVFNKQKIYSYLVALSTVVALFIIAATVGNKTGELIQTISKSKLVPIYNVQTDEQKVAFTMNCAWNADDIDSILATLDKHKVHITFFMVGDWVDKYPEAVKKISDAGHEIANHSDGHKHVNNLDLEENEKEIKSCSDKIKAITGKTTTLYRGPYGEYNNTVIQAAENQKHITIQWSVDTLDYNGLTGDEMWKRLDEKLKNGDIILSHNGTAHTADSLDKLLTNIEQKGFEVVTVSDLIYKDNYTIDSNGTQKKK